LDEDLRSFLELAAEGKMKEGMSGKEALRAVLCCAKLRLASKLTDTMGKPANQPFNLYMCMVA
jgi:hypothetical protein